MILYQRNIPCQQVFHMAKRLISGDPALKTVSCGASQEVLSLAPGMIFLK